MAITTTDPVIPVIYNAPSTLTTRADGPQSQSALYDVKEVRNIDLINDRITPFKVSRHQTPHNSAIEANKVQLFNR